MGRSPSRVGAGEQSCSSSLTAWHQAGGAKKNNKLAPLSVPMLTVVRARRADEQFALRANFDERPFDIEQKLRHRHRLSYNSRLVRTSRVGLRRTPRILDESRRVEQSGDLRVANGLERLLLFQKRRKIFDGLRCATRTSVHRMRSEQLCRCAPRCNDHAQSRFTVARHVLKKSTRFQLVFASCRSMEMVTLSGYLLYEGQPLMPREPRRF